MDMIEKCKRAYIDARPFDRQRARQVSKIAAPPHGLSVDVTRRLFESWETNGLPPEVPIIFGLACRPPVVKAPTPTSAGFYWAKHLNPSSEKLDGRRDWEPVEVYDQDVDGKTLRANVLGHEASCELDEFFWGPRIEEPR